MSIKNMTEKQLELPGMNTGFYQYFKNNEINLPTTSEPQVINVEDLDCFYDKQPRLR